MIKGGIKLASTVSSCLVFGSILLLFAVLAYAPGNYALAAYNESRPQVFVSAQADEAAWVPTEGWTRLGSNMGATETDPHKCEYRIVDTTLEIRPLANAESTEFRFNYDTTLGDDSWKCDSVVFSGKLVPADNESFHWMFHLCGAKAISGLECIDTSHVDDMSGAFCDLSLLESVDICDLDTSNVRNMRFMFAGCTSLESIDFGDSGTRFDTSSVTDMSGMFANCFSLRNINITSFDTSQVTLMGGQYAEAIPFLDTGRQDSIWKPRGMFANCESLEVLNLSTFDTANVQNMSAMFSGCSKLKRLDVSNFNSASLHKVSDELGLYNNSHTGASQGVSYGSMFGGCASLETIVFGPFNPLSHVDDATGLFSGCTKLAFIDCGAWNTSSVRTMSDLFSGCAALPAVDICKWNTSNVTSMDRMFSGCESLKKVDVSGLDTSNVKSMEGMFRGCSNLNTVIVSDAFIGEDCSDVDELFYGCPMLRVIPSNFSFGPNPKMISKSRCFYVEGFVDSLVGGVYDWSETGNRRALLPTTYAGVDSYVKTYTWEDDFRGFAGSDIQGTAILRGHPSYDSVLTVDISLEDNCSISEFAVQWFVSDNADGTNPKAVYTSGWWRGYYRTDPHTFMPHEGDETHGKYYFYRAVDKYGGHSGYLQSNVVGPFVPYTDISRAQISLTSTSYTYDGTAKKPSVTVKLEGAMLKEGTDYTVSYSSNVNVGIAKAIVTGKGNYTGTASVAFSIAKAANVISMQTAAVVKTGSASKAVTFTRAAKAISGAVKYASSSKYVTVSNAGKVTVRKNWTGTAKVTASSPASANYEAAAPTSFVVKVKPGKMSVKKATNVKGATAKVTWVKMAGADKYQVRVALNVKFTKGKKTYSVAARSASKITGKLKKGKTYYVQVRAFDKQTNCWGAWSAAKKVKIRK